MAPEHEWEFHPDFGVEVKFTRDSCKKLGICGHIAAKSQSDTPHQFHRLVVPPGLKTVPDFPIPQSPWFIRLLWKSEMDHVVSYLFH